MSQSATLLLIWLNVELLGQLGAHITVQVRPVEKSALLRRLLFRSLSGKESACQCRRIRRHGFNRWMRKIPWRRKWQPTPVFLSGKILWTLEPGRLWFMGSQRVGHNGTDTPHWETVMQTHSSESPDLGIVFKSANLWFSWPSYSIFWANQPSYWFSQSFSRQ